MNLTPDQEIEQILYSALGSKVREYLTDPLVTEIRINSDNRLWVNRLGEGRSFTGTFVPSEDTKRAIFAVASTVHEVCDQQHRMISAELVGSGARFQGVLPPLTQNPVVVIRKKAIRIFTLEDFVQQGVLSEQGRLYLKDTILNRKNILIVGGTDSGKTTFANGLLDVIKGSHDRVVIIEDISELQCNASDVEYLRTKDGLANLRDLVRVTMRLSPDRIVIGEVRGAEALDLLKAWNTGHSGGISTVHANSAIQGLSRIEQLAQESGTYASRTMISEAVNVVVYLEKYKGIRAVREILEVKGEKEGSYDLLPVVIKELI